MKKSGIPTRQQIEALTAFLPRLYAEGFAPVLNWEGGKQKDGTSSLPYPRYDPVVEEFYRSFGGGDWIDYEHDPEHAYEMLKDEERIKIASLDQIKTMLTFCLRGERFSDGHWAEMIEKGYIRRLLERLNEIAEQMK
jgi:hypothetical protein